MKLLKFFSIFFILLATLVVPASAYHYNKGYGQSAAYNYNRFGVETGFNPFNARNHGGRYAEPRSFIDINTELDYKLWKNPGLLSPRPSVNHRRYLRGFQRGFFTHMGSPSGVTGRIR